VLSFATSVVALAFSAIALAVSIASYRISRRNFLDERLIVLRGKFDEKQDIVELSPTTDSLILQFANVVFPTEVSEIKTARGSSMRIGLFDAVRYIQGMLGKIEDYKFKEGFLKVGGGNVPIIINSFYVAKGAAYGDLSLYVLHFRFVLGGETSKTLRVTFDSLVFLRKLSFKGELDAQSYLDKIHKEPAFEVYAPSVTEIRIK
jgi:hypothetical protein